MSSITGISSTRISNVFVYTQLARQMMSDQVELFNVESQISTGHRYQLPSENPVSAEQVIDYQRVLEQMGQYVRNIGSSQTYLATADTALQEASNLVASARSSILAVCGDTAYFTELNATAEVIQQTTASLAAIANRNLGGRYLFAGSNTGVQPYRFTEAGYVEFLGNNGKLYSYSSATTVFETNVSGIEAFGGESAQVDGTKDLDPVLTFDTPVSALQDGQISALGSIRVSNGPSTKTIDLSQADTVLDVCRLIQADPPTGSNLSVGITPDGSFTVQLDSGNLTILDEEGGKTAKQLGILCPGGYGTNLFVGEDVDPALLETTELDDILGVRATAKMVNFVTRDSNIVFEADDIGTAANGITITFANTATLGTENVSWDAGTRTLTANIAQDQTTAERVVQLVNKAHDDGYIDFTAAVDPVDLTYGGTGPVTVGTVTLEGGDGTGFDRQSGFLVENAGTSEVISIQNATTVEDLLNAFNISDLGLRAEINEDKTGINVHSLLSGCDFAIGENGGTTAADFGLRSFTEATALSSLNFGRGVDIVDGVEFTIVRNDGVELEIDLNDDDTTIDDVLEAINDNVNNADHKLTATLVETGNGISLVDTSWNATAPSTLNVTRSETSLAAIDLGLIPSGLDINRTSWPTEDASAILGTAAIPDAQLEFTAQTAGPAANGLTIQFVDNGGGVPVSGFSYDGITLEIEINTLTATATDIKNYYDANCGAVPFDCELYPAGSTGGGLSGADVAVTAGGTQTLDGTDVNPLEAEGFFNAFIRLQNMLQAETAWDPAGYDVQRLVEQLEDQADELYYVQTELGAREQSVEFQLSVVEDEMLQYEATLSVEYDTDMIEAITRYTQMQASFEASLKVSGEILQMSLIDYL